MRRAALAAGFPGPIFVHQAHPAVAERFFARRAPDARAIADVEGRLFTAFGLRRGSLAERTRRGLRRVRRYVSRGRGVDKWAIAAWMLVDCCWCQKQEAGVLAAFLMFVFIVGNDPVTTCAPLDHFGLAVDSLEEFEDTLARAKAYRARDDRVEIVDHEVEDHTVLKLHNFYVRFQLPLMVEIQHYEMTGESTPAS